MNRFELVRAQTTAQARDLAAEKPGSVLKAGGIDVLDRLKEHLIEPPRLVDLKTIPGLAQISVDKDGTLKIGALATLAQVAGHAAVRASHPALARACGEAASPPVRNVATIGGHPLPRPRRWCYPPPGGRRRAARGLRRLVRARRAEGRARGAGCRLLPAAGPGPHPRERAGAGRAAEGDPRALGRGLEVGVLRGARAGGARLAARLGGGRAHGVGVGRAARVVRGQVATIPWRSAAAEKALVGKPVNATSAEAAGKAAVEGAQPMSDNGYKVDLTATLVRRTVAPLA